MTATTDGTYHPHMPVPERVWLFARYLAQHPGATRAELAAEFDCTDTVVGYVLADGITGTYGKTRRVPLPARFGDDVTATAVRLLGRDPRS